jgi:hypothetical protein
MMPVYVQHEALGKVNDVFDPDALWQAPGLALFARRPLLRDLLERAPREHRGRAATRCFAHVTLLLPQEEVDDDRHLSRGARARDLAHGLAALHQKDFGDLLAGDEVRYHVLGAAHLAPGEVDVKFGHAVYLPAPGEPVRYAVSVSRDSAVWKTICPIYPDQRLTLVGHDEHGATCAAPDWPFGADGAVLIINDGPDTPPEVQVRPKDAFECKYDDAAGYYTIRSRRGAVDATGAPLRLLLRIAPVQPAVAANAVAAAAAAASADATPRTPARATATRMSFAHPLPGREALPGAAASLRTATAPAAARSGAAASPASPPPAMPDRAGFMPATQPGSVAPPDARPDSGTRPRGAPAAVARPAVWKPRTPADDERTALPRARPAPRSAAAADDEATYAPLSHRRVCLAALALPRLSRYRDTGAQVLQVGLNRAMLPTGDGGDSLIAFAVDQDDGLHAITAAGRERIDAPSMFSPVDGATLQLMAPAPQMAERYRALLRLPRPPAQPLAQGVRCVFGRAMPGLGALRVLDSPRFLRTVQGVAPSSADRLGLSRSAFSVESDGDGWRIARLSPTQALYHLDPEFGFVAAITDASPDAPYSLPAGHHLVAGHYVLRFDA